MMSYFCEKNNTTNKLIERFKYWLSYAGLSKFLRLRDGTNIPSVHLEDEDNGKPLLIKSVGSEIN